MDWLITAARGKPKPPDEYTAMTNADLADQLDEHAKAVPVPLYGWWTPPGEKLLAEAARRLREGI